jgi:aerobic C4-dicarboxylate transport protein
MASLTASDTPAKPRKKSFFAKLYVQVLIGIILGAGIGHFYPTIGADMKPLGDGFIKLIKMLVGPIIFCTVVTGIASMGDMKQAGRVGVKALVYFMVLTFASLAIGLTVANVAKPGAGMNIDAATLSNENVATYVGKKEQVESLSEFVLHIIPKTAVSAFAEGEILQVLFFALLFAGAVMVMGEKAKPVFNLVDNLSHLFFTIIGFIMKLAPVGAFGAMAFTVGEYGLESLIPLSKLLLCFYLTCILFIVFAIGGIMAYTGLNIFQFISYIKEEIFIVFGTCSSETVFPRMIDKLTALGCDKSVVGMVLPTGYSFNLDGTAIYLTMAAIFLAQATNTPMTIQEELILLGVMMLTSKGAAGVVGTAFVALAATLASIGHIPVASIALILGVDRFLAEGRAVTNLIGNGVATLFIAKIEGELDLEKARAILSGKRAPELETNNV